MATRSPSLLTIPHDLLVHIAFETALVDALGPPSHLTSLLCTCKEIHAALASSTDLYSRIFKAKFDISAARRRFGPIALLSRNLTLQLKTYCTALQRIRHGDIYAPTLEEDLWTAYVMMLESDGKNAAQLKEYASLPPFMDRLVRTRLWETTSDSGWPLENTINNLSVWLLWMVTDRPTMLAESIEARDHMIRLLLPFVVACFRYASFYAADVHFALPLIRAEAPNLDFLHSHSVATPHGQHPQYLNLPTYTFQQHYGIKMEVITPPIAAAAQLIYFARRELHGLPIPMGLLPDRAAALAVGEPTGPTRADYENFNAFPGAKVLSWGEWDWTSELTEEEREFANGDMLQPGMKCLSARFDPDWERLTMCLDPWKATSGGGGQCVRYLPGSLMGRWVGRMFVPDEMEYMSLMQDPVFPANFSEMFPRAGLRLLDMKIREHHCISPQEPVRVAKLDDKLDEGVRNGYLPSMSSSVHSGGVTFIELEGPREGERFEYSAVGPSGEPEGEGKHNEDTCAYCIWQRDREEQEREERRREVVEDLFTQAGVGMEVDEDALGQDEDADDDDEWSVINEPTKCHGRLDIAFTGLTDQAHGNAWCHYLYYGRLREWDGLIVLVGVPNDVNAAYWGKWIFRGYLHGGQNFTGRWRHYAYDVYVPPYEGPFSLSKRDDN